MARPPSARCPSAAVLLLHGGAETGLAAPPPGPLNLATVRMRPFARSIAGATGGGPGGILVRTARYAHRGWNSPREDPLHDAVRALDALRREAGGSRWSWSATRWAPAPPSARPDHPLVRGVVGLAPWCPDDDPVDQPAVDGTLDLDLLGA